jgi:hypothetical protein
LFEILSARELFARAAVASDSEFSGSKDPEAFAMTSPSL